jgi:hypothetical protein
VINLKKKPEPAGYMSGIPPKKLNPREALASLFLSKKLSDPSAAKLYIRKNSPTREKLALN